MFPVLTWSASTSLSAFFNIAHICSASAANLAESSNADHVSQCSERKHFTEGIYTHDDFGTIGTGRLTPLVPTNVQRILGSRWTLIAFEQTMQLSRMQSEREASSSTLGVSTPNTLPAFPMILSVRLVSAIAPD